jgi:hypothetical protein
MTGSDDEYGTPRPASGPLAGQRFGRGAPGPRQGDGTDPIVDNPHLPLMDVDTQPRPQAIAGEILLMDDVRPDAPEAGRGRMPDTPAAVTPDSPPEGGYPPQRPAQRPAAASRADEAGGYLRLLMQVKEGVMSVVGASRVAGPLVQPGPTQGGLAYAVDLGSEQLGAGDVPDPGVRRGLASPDRPDRGHAFVEAPAYEFTVRIPIEQVRMESLADMQIAVYRLDSAQVTELRADQPLRAQVGRAAERLTTLRGIRTEELAEEVRVSLERALS